MNTNSKQQNQNDGNQHTPFNTNFKCEFPLSLQSKGTCSFYKENPFFFCCLGKKKIYLTFKDRYQFKVKEWGGSIPRKWNQETKRCCYPNI